MDIDRYKELLVLPLEYNDPEISTYIPKIKDVDVERGYIERYFIQKSNDTSSYIFEISKTSVGKYSGNSFFSLVSLDWRITGDPIDIKKSNSASIRIASQKIPKIGMYLPNLLQFHQK